MRDYADCSLPTSLYRRSILFRERTGLGSKQVTGHRVRDGTVVVSTSDYLNWLTCPGYSWAIMHQPELTPPEDATTRRKQIAEDTVETLARTLFPDGLLVDTEDTDEASLRTRDAMVAGADVIFRGTVATDRGLRARADVLVREETGWHLIEIKSSAADPAKPNGAVKKHLPEVAFQTFVFEEAGVPISRSSLLHVNKHYRRNGEVRPEDVLALTDISTFVRKSRSGTLAGIDAALACLQDRSHAARCDCDRKTRANRCELFDYFHPDIPAQDTIYHITGIHRSMLLPAIDRGIVHLVDWPDDLPLSPKQRRQVELARSGRQVLQRDRIVALFSELRYPLSFLDYETFQQPIPLWEGFTPQQQVPFQYSLHVVEEDGVTTHHEHLCTARGENPIPDLVRNLRSHLGDDGSVIVWNKSFEESRNKEMAALLPEEAPFLDQINRRMVDLADVVSKGWWVHPEFGGRWSLKAVLPVAAPDLGYGDLEIGNGGAASERWTQCMVDGSDAVSEQERAEVIEALRTYCHLDTLAMIRIWEHVLDLITASSGTKPTIG